MSFSFPILPGGHLLAIEGLEPPHIGALLELAESYALLNRSGKTQRDLPVPAGNRHVHRAIIAVERMRRSRIGGETAIQWPATRSGL